LTKHFVFGPHARRLALDVHRVLREI